MDRLSLPTRVAIKRELLTAARQMQKKARERRKASYDGEAEGLELAADALMRRAQRVVPQ